MLTFRFPITAARLVLDPEVTVQSPPNLNPGRTAALIDAGLDDWGGISPVTIDHVNPEAPWPQIEALGAELRDNPTDTQRRIFLFELLCFAGNHDRAEKQLDILSSGGPEAGMGTLLYRSALHAERVRAEMFRKQTFPLDSAPSGDASGCHG